MLDSLKLRKDQLTNNELCNKSISYYLFFLFYIFFPIFRFFFFGGGGGGGGGQISMVQEKVLALLPSTTRTCVRHCL